MKLAYVNACVWFSKRPIQTRVSRRVLRWFVHRTLLDPDDARAMREWHNDGGFSLDAAVRFPAWDRAALERLLRYCARPSSALERLEAIDDAHLRYHLADLNRRLEAGLRICQPNPREPSPSNGRGRWHLRSPAQERLPSACSPASLNGTVTDIRIVMRLDFLSLSFILRMASPGRS